MADLESVRIVPAATDRVLRPDQKKFNTLIKQIEQARKTLAAWRDNSAHYALAYAQVQLPLHQQIQGLRRRWAFALDSALARPGWTRAERETLIEMVCDAAADLLEDDHEDAELRALFAKHAEIDFEVERLESLRALKELAEDATGLDLGDDEGITSEEDLLQRMGQGMHEREQADAAAHDAKLADAAANDAKQARHRKTAAQQRREAAEQQAAQSVREVFRKLASALHPDRETDAEKRTLKTTLMQQVNQAYANNDLLTLLELQLQIEHVDAGHMAGADSKRVKHYNKVLAEQLAELKTEISRAEMGFRMDFGLQPGWGLSPLKLGPLLEMEARRLRTEVIQMGQEIAVLDDVAATKRWLKGQRLRLRAREFDIDDFF